MSRKGPLNWRLFLLGICLLCLIVSSCQKKPEENVLVIGLEGNPTNLDPRLATDAYSVRIDSIIFNGLMKLDPRANLLPNLTEKYENPTPTTYRFYLKKGVKFHNGRELTAPDVKYTFETIRDPSFKSPHLNSFEKLKAIKIVDEYTIEFELQEPFAPFLTSLVVGIIPRDIAEQEGEKFGQHPMGTGPFKFRRWVPGSRIELDANPDYYEGLPRLDAVVFKVVPNDTTRVFELKKGSVHLLQNSVPPDSMDILEEDPGIEIIRKDGINYSYIGFNLEDKILSNKKVRQAIAYALNREEIIEYLLKGLAVPATGLLAPSNWAYEGEVARYDYRPETSRKLLDEAGYLDPDGEGPKSRFKLSYRTSTNRLRQRIGEVLARQLREVGIELETRSYEWGTFFADIKSGNFQLYTLTWVGITEPDIYYYVFHSSSVPPQGANRGRYKNEEIDRLLEEGRRCLEQDSRKEIYSRIQKILAEELPYISLWYSTNVVAQTKGIQGFEIYPGGEFTSLKEVYFTQEQP
ncbi:MAG: ABC transporter substrate-binding protein [Deltaproteobacteria bacterium]|nr:MAG: ABC transporter substrate-binding protein [Deltaproteobacteria bacterium]